MLAAMRAASWMASEPFLESGDLRAERMAGYPINGVQSAGKIAPIVP
jgi:hypothetical protein